MNAGGSVGETSPVLLTPDGAHGSQGLSAADHRQLDVVRRFGTVGALLMALGALGAGAAPVLGNPVIGRPVLGLFNRMPTVSMAIVFTGMFMVVLAWLWLGAFAAPGRVTLMSRAQLDRTVIMWAVPLAMAPPMFSRDVYSYLAQVATADRGLNPYLLGPGDALGVDHPLVRGIPTIWRDTPAPYGPLFLTLGRPITWIAGDDVVLGTLLHRGLAVIGLVLIVWALPRLARRVGVSPVFALWLGAANPLVLFHLVSGMHNEALMIGLMLVGLELVLRGAAPNPPKPGPAMVGGVALIAGAALVKVPAVVALAFVAVWLARRRGGHPRDMLLAGTVTGGIAIAVALVVTLVSGLGFTWLGGLSAPTEVRSWLSVTTDAGLLAGWIGTLLGLGDQTSSAIGLARGLGLVISAGICLLLVWRCWQDRLEPVLGIGMALGAAVLFSPVVHPWYLLWAAIPLAASAAHPTFRRSAIIASSVVALLVAPTGADFMFRAWVPPAAVIGAVVVVLIPLLLVRGRTPGLSATLRLGRRHPTPSTPEATGGPQAARASAQADAPRHSASAQADAPRHSASAQADAPRDGAET